MNIYNNLPYDVQFRIDEMLLKEHNNNNTIRVIEELQNREIPSKIWDGILLKRPYMKKDVKTEWIFKKVMKWAITETYKPTYKMLFLIRKFPITQYLKPLQEYIYNNKTFWDNCLFQTSVDVAILWYLKTHYKSVDDIYPLLKKFNQEGIVDVKGLYKIKDIIDDFAYQLNHRFVWTFENVICENDFNAFFDEDEDDN